MPEAIYKMNRGENELDINNKFQQEAASQEKKDFVLELVYENISLMEDYIKLYYENARLRKDLEDLKKLERWWKAGSLKEN